jgi:hypothetical protein
MENVEKCSCGVPISLHSTCCGWQNAGIIAFPGEISFGMVTKPEITPEEREIRWLISQSQNRDALAKYYLGRTTTIITSN